MENGAISNSDTIDTLDTINTSLGVFINIDYECHYLGRCFRWKWVRVRGTNPSWIVEIFCTPYSVSISVTF